MKKIKFIMTTLIALVLASCSALLELEDKTADKVSSLIKKYCEETTPDLRNVYREKINRKLEKSNITIKISCY